MAAGKRIYGESFQAYHSRLKREEADTKRKMAGKWINVGGARLETPIPV